jgi:hypothetical protein
MPEPTPQRPYPESLCHRCTGLKLVHGARSTFLMCLRLPERYPRQPVLECIAFDPLPKGPDPEPM